MESSSPKLPRICLPCHYTCAACAGPQDSQCQACLEDAQLVNLTDTEQKFYCYPKTLVPQIESANWHYRLNVALSIVLFVICFITLYFLLACLLKQFRYFCCGGNYNSNIDIAYNKLAVSEKHQNEVEIEDEINKALNDSSDSESDEDLQQLVAFRPEYYELTDQLNVSDQYNVGMLCKPCRARICDIIIQVSQFLVSILEGRRNRFTVMLRM